MKADFIASHRTLFQLLIGFFDVSLVISIATLWSVDPRRDSPYTEAAGIAVACSIVSLFALWWLLRRDAPGFALISLLSALVGIIGAMFLPAVA